MRRVSGCRVRRTPGFTMVEMLSAIAVLMILALILAALYAGSDRAWRLGTGSIENTAGARAAIAMIKRDLAHAIAGPPLTFVLRPDRNGGASFEFSNDELCFVSLQNDGSDGTRAAREIRYWVDENPDSPGRYQLVRGCRELSSALDSNAVENCYWNTYWYEDSTNAALMPVGVVADNVVALGFDAATPTGRVFEYNSDECGGRLPEYMDIFLEALDERPARQAAEMVSRGMDAAQISEFVELNAKRYVSRVWFRNGDGYAPEHAGGP